MTPEHPFTNSLIHSESPYLRQHAHNPVNWESWSDDIWEKALNENRLVIVSIGYSTCHWCHVMEHESFENIETADFMNENFLCIKVDREERPDIDMVYMDACQLITGRGGWPLNAICLPDKTPVYAGTYFPRDAWNSMLTQLSNMWQKEPQKLLDYAVKMKQGLKQMNLQEFAVQEKIQRKDLHETIEKLLPQLDFEYGGLKRSQKFPMPSVLEYLLDEYLISGNENIKEFLHLTLLKMANGGIYDQIRGGFCRYAVDPYWFAPHFEKMLYDNAQLISVYSRAASIFDVDIYKQIAENTIAFCMRELSDGVGFFSALDADSEGIEGKFYVFTFDELKQLLNEEELNFALVAFHIKENGNWEHGYNIIHNALAPLQILENLKITAADYHRLRNSIIGKLYLAQEKRIRPGLDEKKICSWNAMMLKALTDAAKHISPHYISIANRQCKYMLEQFFVNGKLRRIATKKGAHVPAFAEDYACMIQALVSLYELNADIELIHTIAKLCSQVVELYYDAENAVFYFTANDQRGVLIRKADYSDDVIPASGSILCLALKKAALILNRNDYNLIANDAFKNIKKQALENPAWYSNWCRMAQVEAIGFIQLLITEDPSENHLREMQKMMPEWALILSKKHASTEAMELKLSHPNKWFVCVDESCLEPVNTAENAAEILADILH